MQPWAPHSETLVLDTMSLVTTHKKAREGAGTPKTSSSGDGQGPGALSN